MNQDSVAFSLKEKVNQVIKRIPKTILRKLTMFGLRFRIYATLGAMIVATALLGGVSAWYTYTMNKDFRTMVQGEVTSLQAAVELENSLTGQKGFVSYYFMDGSEDWLESLSRREKEFMDWLIRVTPLNIGENAVLLEKIRNSYFHYSSLRNQVITLYKSGLRQKGRDLHEQAREEYKKVYMLCEQFKLNMQKRIRYSMDNNEKRTTQLNAVVFSSLGAGLIFGLSLALMLVRRVFDPLRRLAEGETINESSGGLMDEVRTLSSRVHSLVSAVAEQEDELEQNRESLAQAQKLATVGKLAAGMAHSVRNPLTAVKMRLYTLGKTLELDESQKDDLDVISEEIRHIDSLLNNFLEFSRPPRIKPERNSVSNVIDNSIALMSQRLNAYGIEVVLNRREPLKPNLVDGERLKEMLVNIVVNCCEAMPEGGRLTVTEEEKILPQGGEVQIIKLEDNGAGVPEDKAPHIFEPFFSTKKEGSGLGLSISKRIIEEHGGSIRLGKSTDGGAAFIITLPFK
jgi:signal transduction histidine kinase